MIDSRKLTVSVILTTYNRADLLPRAVNSVLNQTFTDFELIIVDDCSQDHTSETVQAFRNDRIKYVRHEKNRGLSAARNTGICHASGEYIAFLDDDDEWLPTKLEKQVRYIQDLPESVGMVYCWMDYYENDKVVAQRHPELRGNIFKYVLESQPLGNGSTWLVRRSAIQDIGSFDEALARGIDGNFVRRLCLDYEVDFVPEVLLKYYIGHGHKQITRSDEQGIRNAIRGHSAKLVKFKDELQKYPRQTTNIYTSIAYHYGQLGDWRKAGAFYWRSFETYPFSSKLYKSLIRSLKEQIIKAKNQ